jgi:hypothetical protein
MVQTESSMILLQTRGKGEDGGVPRSLVRQQPGEKLGPLTFSPFPLLFSLFTFGATGI